MQDAMENAKKAQRMVEIASQQVHDRRMDCPRLSGDYESAEHDLTEGLGCVCKHGWGYGRDNECIVLCDISDTLRLVDSVLCREARDDFEFVTAENSSSP